MNQQNLVTREINGRMYKLPEGLTPEEEQAYVADDNLPDEDAVSITPEVVEQEAVAPQYTAFAPVPEKIEASELATNADWLNASRLSYQALSRKPFEGTDEELAEWSRKAMADFNFNLLDTGLMARRITQSTQEEKEAFLYLMDTFDNVSISTKGVLNAAGAVVTDPFVLASAFSLGVGGAVRQGASMAARQSLRQQLRTSLGRTGVVAGAEGALIGYYDDKMRQNVEWSAGRLEGRDYVRSLQQATAGAAVGVTLGTTLDFTAVKLASLWDKFLPKGKAGSEVIPDGTANPPMTPMDKDVNAVNPQPLENKLGDIPTFTAPDAPAPDMLTRVGDKWTLGSLEMPINEKTLLKDKTPFKDIRAFAEGVAGQLARLTPDQAQDMIETFGINRLTQAEFRDFSFSVQMAKDSLTHEFRRATRLAEVDPSMKNIVEAKELESLYNAIAVLDENQMASNTAKVLRGRQEGEIDLNKLSPQSLMEEGIPESQLWDEFNKRYDAAMSTREFKEFAEQFDTAIDDAYKQGNFQEVSRLLTAKYRTQDEFMGILPEDLKEARGMAAKLTEAAIGNVFSPNTLLVNATASSLKTLILPTFRAFLSDPLDLATRKQAFAQYNAMMGASKGAFRAAKASWRYEQLVMSRDPDKFLESNLAIEGKKAIIWRFFIRGTTATDEFLSQINFAGHIAGEAAYEATKAAQEQGLKGKALDSYVAKAVKEANENAFIKTEVDKMLVPIINKAKNLKLQGDDFVEYVRKEAMRDPEALKVANLGDDGINDRANEYLRDILYKREFSGEGLASGFFKSVESYLNANPAMKLVSGMLFMRTPVRVFEEAIRVTPAFQMLAPNMLKDLTGANGKAAELRARTQALISVGLGGMIVTGYAEGSLQTYADRDNPQQLSTIRDSHLADPYTIKLDDGSTLNTRYLDPLGSSVKLIVASLEQMDKLTIRKAQGEEISEEMWAKAGQSMQIGLISIYKAVEDASLFEGFNGITRIIDAATADTDTSAGGMLQVVGEKLRLMVPATARKERNFWDEDTRFRNPATMAQMIQSQLLDPLNVDQFVTSYAYDALGRRRQQADLGAYRWMFSTATPEERLKDRTPAETYVFQELVRLEGETGAVFTQRFTKHPDTADLDYRTVLTKDGKETLFDKWNRYYGEQVDINGLTEVLSAEMPEGTMKYQGMKVERVRSMLQQAKDIAYTRLKAEETSIIERAVQEKQNKLFGRFGLKDLDRTTPTPPVQTPVFE